MRKRSILPTALLFAVLLVGCAGTDVDEIGAPPAISSSPTGTDVEEDQAQARETGLVAPAQVFGGDCANLLTEAEASEILGYPATLSVPYTGFGGIPTVELHGGLRCIWDAGIESYTYIIADLVPASVVDFGASTTCHLGDGVAVSICDVDMSANETRLSARISTSRDYPETPSTAIKEFTQKFETHANAATPAPAPIPAIGSWALPVDCASVVAAGDFSGVSGLGASSTGGVGGGVGGYFLSTASGKLAGTGGFYLCRVQNGTTYVDYFVMAGARWRESAVATYATPLQLSGHDAAYSSQSEGYAGFTTVDVFDGPNWLQFNVRYIANAQSLADALVAALDTSALE